MKRFGAVAFFSLLTFGLAEEGAKQVLSLDSSNPEMPAVKPKADPENPKEGWIGVSVRKADAALLAQLAEVPKGVGFTLVDLNPAGPAARAGLQPYDFVWKLNDQLLVNEGQFITLLALHNVGETIQLTYQRRGENNVAEVVLEERPAAATGRSQAATRSTFPFIPGMPMREISVQERFAAHEDDEGIVKVRRAAEHFSWVSQDAKGKILGRGRIDLPDERGEVSFPKNFDPVLKNKLSALVRAYEHAAGRGTSTIRKPRVRRVPTPRDEVEIGKE